MTKESKVIIETNEFQTPITEELRETNEYTVYRHISPSGKIYVGITKLSLHSRWKRQGVGYRRCKLFYKAIQKYGWHNIIHEVILTGVCKSEAIYAERYLIRWYKLHGVSYNITDGGESTDGISMPEDAKEKISLFMRNRQSKTVLQYSINGEFIAEYKSALEAANILGYGKTSVSNCASGIKRENVLHGFIFIYKDKLDSLDRRLELCREHWRRYRIMQCANGECINIFDSIREAERVTGVNRVCIRKNINGEFNTAGGYTWKKKIIG